MKTLAKALLVLLALLPVGILLWLAVPQIPLLWNDRDYWRGYAASLGLTAVILLFQLAVALPAAYGLARWRGRLRDAAYLLYCLLTLLPVQVMLLPNYLVCRALGLLNTQLAIVLLGVFSPLSVFLLLAPCSASAWSRAKPPRWTGPELGRFFTASICRR